MTEEKNLTERVYAHIAEWHHKTNGRSSNAILLGLLTGALVLGLVGGYYLRKDNNKTPENKAILQQNMQQSIQQQYMPTPVVKIPAVNYQK